MHAFAHPRQINQDLVDAQQARRIVDRLVGYTLSPLISRKVRSGLSAGRVQSVAVRLVVEREREIRGFVAREYWTIAARLVAPDGTPFDADLVRIDGAKPEIGDGATAETHVEALRTSRPLVAEVGTKKSKRSPAPPFTTSTLQQEASRKLGFSPKRTMSVAQKLYEGVDTPDGHVGPDHLHADRLGVDGRPGPRPGPRGDRGPLRGRLHDAEGARLPDEVEERPGGPRGDPPDLVRPRPRGARRPPGPRRGPPLPPDLAACPRQPDEGEGARDDDGRPGGRRVPAPRERHPDALRRLRGGLLGGARRRRGRRGGHPAAAGRRRGHDGRRGHPDPALHGAAAPLHGGKPDQGPRGERDRPAVDLRRHDLHDRRSRLRRRPRTAAPPRARGRGGHGSPRRPLRRVRRSRLHGPDGGGARRGRPRRAHLGAAPGRVLRPAPGAGGREAARS